MFRCIIWRDDTKADGECYSLLDPVTREPLLGEDDQQLTNLWFKQAMDLLDRLTRLQKRSGRPFSDEAMQEILGTEPEPLSQVDEAQQLP
jgi:hypothetical protein